MHVARTFLVPALLGLGLGIGLGCTAILAPKDDVETCNNVDDCPPPEDGRYEARCVREDTDFDGVCVAGFRSNISCDEGAYGIPEQGHPFAVAFDEWATGDRYMFTACTNDPNLAGSQGCPPPCKDGLSENAFGVCDDDDPSTPPAVQPTSDLVGQDVRDQFCRSFFCDNRFVCDRSNESRPLCVLCDPDKPYGQGGCGDLYIGGAPSCIYQTAAELDAACKAPDVSLDMVSFGDCSG